jgi:hypothetical protein
MSRPRACALGAALVGVHFVCFYWWAAGEYFFTGDALFYFSRPITSFGDLWTRLISVDDLYQYRPLPYVFFSFVLYPLFGTTPAPYHLAAYLIASVNALLACACLYFWLRRDKSLTLIASAFVLLNPVNFFPSFGPSFTDVLLAGFFYYLALLLILWNSRLAQVAAPLSAILALLSRESVVVLPIAAMLILLVTGTSLRDALSRTRNVWLVVAVYAVFQFVIRNGALFAPAEANPNLQFGFSADRLLELVKGIKPAIFYPENYHLSILSFELGRPGRLAFLIPWLALVIWALFRRNKLALSGLVWVPISLLPVAFLQVSIAPRHYYLAIPGLAVAFSLVLRNTRMPGAVIAILALVTITNTAIYQQDSWIAKGAVLTKTYLRDIDRTANRTGRAEFYVLDSGDRNFYWHIDGGAPLKQFLQRDYWFSFAAARQPLNIDRLLANQVNVVTPTSPGLREALKSREFPELKRHRLCGSASRIIRFEGPCGVFYRGRPVQEEAPFFDTGEGFVTLSRTTLFLENSKGVEITGSARLSPDSTDGVSVELFTASSGMFHPVWKKDIRPGQRVTISSRIGPSPASLVVLRIGPGPMGEETGDRLIWRLPEGN